MPPGNKRSSPSLGKTFSLVAVLTFLSKFVGLARDIIVLQAYGAGWITDAYNYAYLLTGNVLILFGGLGGPFHQSTVAIVQPKKHDADVGKLIFQLVAFTSIVLGVITLALWAATPLFVRAMTTAHAGQTADTQLWSTAGVQLEIMLPLILISGIVGILYGISNVYDEYTWPSLSPAIASIAMIVAVLVYKDSVGLCLGYGTLIGAILQLLAQTPATLPHMRWQVSTKPEPGVKEYGKMLWPATISTSIGQLTVYVDSLFASYVKLSSEYKGGAWTAIVNSNRLVQLPLGVLLTAMLVPILPRFTEQVAENRIDDLKAEFRRGLRILWFLSLPMAAILIAIPGPIVELLFQRGQFSEKDTELFVQALIFLVPSIIFYVGRDLITRVFYAHQDSKTPYRVAMYAILLKGLLDWALIGPLGVGGISLSTTLVTIFNLTCLAYLLRRKIGNLGVTSLIRPFAIMMLGSTIAGAAVYFANNAIMSVAPNVVAPIVTRLLHSASEQHAAHIAHQLALLASIGVSSIVAFVLYLGICVVLKLEEPKSFMQRLRRKKPSEQT